MEERQDCLSSRRKRLPGGSLFRFAQRECRVYCQIELPPMPPLELPPLPLPLLPLPLPPPVFPLPLGVVGPFFIGGAAGAAPGMGEPTLEPGVNARSFTCSTTRLMTLRVAGGRAAAGVGVAGTGVAGPPGRKSTAGAVRGLGLAFFFATLRRAGDFAAGRRAAVLFFALFFAAPRFALLRFFELFFAAPLRDFDERFFDERFFVDFLLELFFFDAFFEDLRFDAAMFCLLL
jgi:hypothetical protein